MKVEQYVEKKEEVNQNIVLNQEQTVEIRQVEGGGVKKKINPKVIQTFWFKKHDESFLKILI